MFKVSLKHSKTVSRRQKKYVIKTKIDTKKRSKTDKLTKKGKCNHKIFKQNHKTEKQTEDKIKWAGDIAQWQRYEAPEFDSWE